MRFTVDIVDLRLALISVVVHADPDKEMPQRHRVRLIVGPENVTVSATNNYTMGHALVSIWDHGDGELGTFDLSPADVKQLLAVFTAKRKDDDEPDTALEVDVTDKTVEFVDMSGLFPGKTLKLPRYADDDNFPDLARIIVMKLDAGGESTERLITSGNFVGLFTKAAAAYGQPLVFDPAGTTGSILITCGESFVGMLMPRRPDDETTAKITAWHEAWHRRLRGQLHLVDA